MTKFTLFVSLALAAGSTANDTALHDGRSGPEPLGAVDGKESPVRMVKEYIGVSFGYEYTDVHCTFTFRNTSATGTVEHDVGFPDVGAACDEVMRREPDKDEAKAVGERINTRAIADMRTKVNGVEVKAALKFGEAKPGEDCDSTTVWSFDEKSGVRAWYVVHVEFPAGQDVTVERTYRVRNGSSAAGVAFFDYTTATGAVWNGTIGQLQVDVTLRDEGIKADGLVWPGAAGLRNRVEGDSSRFATAPERIGWEIVDDTHLRLIWKDFEPRTQKDRRGFRLSRPWHGFEDSPVKPSPAGSSAPQGK